VNTRLATVIGMMALLCACGPSMQEKEVGAASAESDRRICQIGQEIQEIDRQETALKEKMWRDSLNRQNTKKATK
jgi:hypothetical protein